MSKHTPGPWIYHEQSNCIKSVGGGFVIGCNDVAPEDIRLIASAPLLLRACARDADEYDDVSEDAAFVRFKERAWRAVDPVRAAHLAGWSAAMDEMVSCFLKRAVKEQS